MRNYRLSARLFITGAVGFVFLGAFLDLPWMYGLAALNVWMAGWQLFKLRRSMDKPQP